MFVTFYLKSYTSLNNSFRSEFNKVAFCGRYNSSYALTFPVCAGTGPQELKLPSCLGAISTAPDNSLVILKVVKLKPFIYYTLGLSKVIF